MTPSNTHRQVLFEVVDDHLVRTVVLTEAPY